MDVRKKESGMTSFSTSKDESISAYISKYGNEQTVLGIDVSSHQGTINWKEVADNGVTFAIIRCGYRGLTKGSVFKDTMFDENVKGALENGIYVGTYFFSTAITDEEALEEAAFVAEVI